MMRIQLVFIYLSICITASLAIRGEWYESYQEDNVPNHVPVEAPHIPKVHGVSRGEWHTYYTPPQFVNRIRKEINKRVSPLRRIFLVKRDLESYNSEYLYHPNDQYSVESNENNHMSSNEGVGQKESSSTKSSFLDRIRDNLSSMMKNIEKNGFGNKDVESFHEQHSQSGNPSLSQQPTFFEKMRRDMNVMLGRVKHFITGSSQQPKKGQLSQVSQDEFTDFNKEFDHSSHNHNSANTHERNYGFFSQSTLDSTSPSFLSSSFKWINDLLGDLFPMLVVLVVLNSIPRHLNESYIQEMASQYTPPTLKNYFQETTSILWDTND
ncbi:unnamed protein product [Lepeophtheirus salmonis]|uniref:(salmon louse) hypothetical protein n=1 Tax=Lepeophtheirus salmonis TaxID=72036 RepID=A0A7R8D1W7_LEPSM|nr:unnamed protein product [Lepeophtheirus salmonis]CAF2998854.1 unnamed protein product [Lepeophtheirus salmonis]